MNIVDPFEKSGGIVDPFATEQPKAKESLPTEDKKTFVARRLFQAMPSEERAEASKQATIGALSAIPGTPGDIETLGRAGLRYAGANVEPESFLPTSRRVAETFGAEEPTTKTSGRYRSAGEILGSFAGPSVVGKSLGVAGEALIGGTTSTVANLAKRAENLGFKLEPRQLRAAEPKGSPGFGAATAGENQKLANELVSAETGAKTKEISPKFIGDRLKDIGDEYSKIFGQNLKVDRQLAAELDNMAAFERSVRPADVRSITAAADNVVNRFAQAQQQVQTPISAIRVDGEVLQRLRNEMSYIARTANDGQTRRTAGEFIEKIDANIARNHKDLVKPLEKANREYAATKALEELVEKGGIQGGNISLEKLGNHLAQNAYGFGSGTARHPLAELGNIGRELKIRGRFEGVETPSGAITGALSKLGQVLNLPGRAQFGRTLQRRLPIEPTGATGAVVAPVSAAGRAVEEPQ